MPLNTWQWLAWKVERNQKSKFIVTVDSHRTKQLLIDDKY